jgi:hypothetical protein
MDITPAELQTELEKVINDHYGIEDISLCVSKAPEKYGSISVKIKENSMEALNDDELTKLKG